MATVSNIMIKKNIPLVNASSKFSLLLEKTTRSNLGLAIITDDKKKLIGVISDGDIKKLSSVRKTIAETTYGPKKDKNEQFYSSSTVKE